MLNYRHKSMDKLMKLFFLLLVLAGITVSCGDEPLPEEEPDENQAPELTQKINTFIKDVMTDVYLWYKDLPDIDIKYEFDSKAYFKKLMNTEDKWSFVTDDVTALENSFQGIEKSYGWSLAFGRFSDTGNIFALVEFVYPNTPAAKAGFKRGDLIYQMSGGVISENNYMDLLNGNSLTVTYGQYTAAGISNSKTVSMTALELNLNPVVLSKIIDHGGRKIGYLLYAQYISNYNTSLDSVFQNFVAAKVTDVVIDLRYNPGGTTTAAQHLCSSIAPVTVVNGAQKLVSFRWNDKYQKYWEDGNVMSQLQINFLPNVPVKMGLSKVHILTGTGTASASELSITGLKPYMTVKTIGETTYGKYTASITLKPEDLYDDTPNYYKEFTNWGVQPIILRYANSLGVTDFKEGFAPDIPVEDDLFSGIALGSKSEPLLKAALEDITGQQVVAMKSAKITRPYEMFDRGFSKYDANKREVVYNAENKKLLFGK